MKTDVVLKINVTVIHTYYLPTKRKRTTAFFFLSEKLRI